MRTFVTLLLLLCTACAGAHVYTGRPLRATVLVDNASWDRITIRVRENGNPGYRLGAVDAMTHARFTLPVRPAVGYEFVLVPFGHEADAWPLGASGVPAGSMVKLHIENHLPYSGAIVELP